MGGATGDGARTLADAAHRQAWLIVLLRSNVAVRRNRDGGRSDEFRGWE
jgi:hypothetical protein